MMFDPDPRRGGWAGRQPFIAGICASLATEFDLPPAVVRGVAVVFAVLPTGLTYLALAWLAGQRRARPGYGRAMPGFSAGPIAASPSGREALLLRQRFVALESRLKPMEAFVSSKDFELHKGFRQMRS